MCARFIVDQNAIFIILDPNAYGSERDPLFRDWYDDGHGSLFYADTGTYAEAGKAKLISERQLREAERELDRQLGEADFELRSNDRHMLALSLAAEATILCTRDKALQGDFLNLNANGETRVVYPINPKGRPSREQEQIRFLERNRCEMTAPA